MIEGYVLNTFLKKEMLSSIFENTFYVLAPTFPRTEHLLVVYNANVTVYMPVVQI